jgi:two-component system response regulator LytT
MNEPVNPVNATPPEVMPRAGKRSFLVFKHNKYITVPTQHIAFFYVKYDSPFIVCKDLREYAVNYSLKQIHNLVTDQQFFRLNKQYLINFDAVKEVEHYFARKLLVKLIVDAPDKLLVAKEKAADFLRWLENR